jgi:hypothetical protein
MRGPRTLAYVADATARSLADTSPWSCHDPSKAGLVPTILGMGVLYLLVTSGMFFNRSLRQMDTRFHH